MTLIVVARARCRRLDPNTRFREFIIPLCRKCSKADARSSYNTYSIYTDRPVPFSVRSRRRLGFCRNGGFRGQFTPFWTPAPIYKPRRPRTAVRRASGAPPELLYKGAPRDPSRNTPGRLLRTTQVPTHRRATFPGKDVRRFCSQRSCADGSTRNCSSDS